MQQDIFTVRLQSTNLNGLRVPPIRAAYMMQYRNGLIGKHFKTLMQTMIFHIKDIVTPDQFALVRALGELGYSSSRAAGIIFASKLNQTTRRVERSSVISHRITTNLAPNEAMN